MHLASCKFIWLNWLQLAIPLHHFTVVSWIINSGNKSTKNTKYVSSLCDMTKVIAVLKQYVLALNFYIISLFYWILSYWYNRKMQIFLCIPDQIYCSRTIFKFETNYELNFCEQYNMHIEPTWFFSNNSTSCVFYQLYFGLWNEVEHLSSSPSSSA